MSGGQRTGFAVLTARRRHRYLALLAVLVAALPVAAACRAANTTTGQATPAPVNHPLPQNVIPVPVDMKPGSEPFTLTESTRILTPSGSAEAARIGDYLAGILRPSTGFSVPVQQFADVPSRHNITLKLTGGDKLGAEGYRLEVNSKAVTLEADEPAGLFYGVQTLRQLMPAGIESSTLQPGPWRVAGGTITDHPRYAWRGAALDSARHFFSVEEAKRYIDLISLYKINTLHLRLSDDQGWRIAIDGRPKLTEIGGRTEIGGGPGGYYTKAQYSELVNYAKDRYITVIPEIDLPGHTNAAQVSYPELNCDGKAPPPYTKIGGPPRSVCVDKPSTDAFVSDVVGTLAALTPGPYIHVGGDEVLNLTTEQYTSFMDRVQKIVGAQGKRALGWDEIAHAPLSPDTVVQYWNTNKDAKQDALVAAAGRGTKVVMSPAAKTYFDMKYDEKTSLGLKWAGYVEVRDAYDWDPASVLPGVGDGSVLGVESELFSETLEDIEDVEYMTFPRLPALAEVGWSPADAKDWDGFRQRLAAQAPRWSALSVNYYHSPQIAWPK